MCQAPVGWVSNSSAVWRCVRRKFFSRLSPCGSQNSTLPPSKDVSQAPLGAAQPSVHAVVLLLLGGGRANVNALAGSGAGHPQNAGLIFNQSHPGSEPVSQVIVPAS